MNEKEIKNWTQARGWTKRRKGVKERRWSAWYCSSASGFLGWWWLEHGWVVADSSMGVGEGKKCGAGGGPLPVMTCRRSHSPCFLPQSFAWWSYRESSPHTITFGRLGPQTWLLFWINNNFIKEGKKNIQQQKAQGHKKRSSGITLELTTKSKPTLN